MYTLRYFFDPGSGTCLWSANDEARARFGYAVNLEALPLTPETMRRLTELVVWHDRHVSKDDPAGPLISDVSDRAKFDQATVDVLHRLRTELQGCFEIIDESRPLASG